MSNSRFILYAIPNEKIVAENGAVKTTLKFNAANIRQARAMGTMSFIERYPEANDEDYELVVYEETTGLPCGPLDVWDEEVLSHYFWNDATKLPEYCKPGNEGEPDFVEFDKLSTLLKAAVLVKFGTTEVTADMLTAALDLTQEESATFDGHIVEAITRTPAIYAMYPERQLEAIAHIREKCKPTKKWPEIKAALELWLKSHEKDRKDAAAESARETVIAEDTTSAYAGRAYQHTYRTLNKEIAYALWAGDVDAAKTDSSISRWADGIITDDREDWKRWSAAIVTRENILAYDRPTIFGMVRNTQDPEIYKTPTKLNDYIDDYLQTQGVIEGGSHETTQQNPENETDTLASTAAASDAVEQQQSDSPAETPPVERQGPFYYRTTDGQVGRANKLAKLEAVVDEGCCEISKEEYQQLKDAPPAQKPASNQPDVTNLGDGKFTIAGLTGETQSETSVNAKPSEATVPAPEKNDFQVIAEALDKELNTDKDNLKIWRSVMRTDPRYTKDLSGTGFSGTSINAEYMVMRATEIFGPLGTGWGYDILEDRMLPGAPMSEAIYEDKKFVGKKLIRDADGTLITEMNHSLKIDFWYVNENGKKGRFEEYGATPYMYMTSGNKIYCDSEVLKKSLTDAIKKSLSLLGFSADVWLGHYDREEYKQENATEFAIKNASDKAEDVTRLRKELDEKLTTNAATLEKATTPNEAKKIYDVIAREAEAHRKAADAKGDKEHAEYLASRLRRLAAIKDQRIKELTEEPAE
ncbi:exodeoxyribonuclease VIII [Lelliottia nimipressuralis]